MSPTTPIRVLHVDDDPEFAEVVATFLERGNERFSVETATNASEGLTRLADDAFECVVSDYDMPGRNGIEFLKAVREDSPDLPFVLYTGKGSEEVASEAISAGVTDYLQKHRDTDRYELLATRVETAVAQHRTERELSRKNDLFRKVQDLAAVGAWEWYPQERDGYYSDSVYDIYGVDSWSDRSPDADIRKFYHPDDREALRTAFRTAIDTGEPYDIEARIVTPDGTEKWVRTRGDPQFADGECVRIRGTIQDITEHKTRERHLERFEHIVEDSPELVVILNEDMTVAYQNPPSLALEVDPRRIAGENPLEYVHDDDVPRVAEDFRRALAEPDSIVRTEFRAADADGDWQWFESRTQNCLGTAVDGLLVTVREVTDRKRAQRRLAAYSATLEEMQETAQTLLGARDTSEAAETVISGIEEAMSFDIAGMWLFDESADALVPTALTRAGAELFADPPTYTGADESLSWDAFRDGTIKTIRDLAAHEERYNPDTPLGSELIVPVGEYGVLNVGSTGRDAFDDRDVLLCELWAETAKVAFERITREQRLQEREAVLERERDRLDEFAGVVSHDLRNPLNVAAGSVELARRECESGRLADAARALDRMETLIDHVLTLSRTGDDISDTEPVDLDALIEDGWRTVATDDATLVGTVDRTVLADADRLRQLVGNLVGNSVEHAGGSVRIRVGELPTGFYIEDDGPGIPEDERQDVFEMGHSTTNAGTGFGLSIVKRIVDAHGWDVRITGGPDGGARFEITGVEFHDGPRS